MRNILLFLIQITYGILQTMTGFIVFLFNGRYKHFLFNGSIVTIWNRPTSVSLGAFIFISGYNLKDKSRNGILESKHKSFILTHEYGHFVQSLVLGPLYLAVIGIPSVIWLNFIYKSRENKYGSYDYYSFPIESNANLLGRKLLKNSSKGL